METEFLPILRKFSVLLRCKALHAANGTQPNFAKEEEVNGAAKNHFKLAMASAFSANTLSIIVTFSSVG